MTRRIVPGVLVFEILVSAAVLSLVVVLPNAVAQRAGGVSAEENSITVDERQRTYLVYAPAKSDGPMPLVFVLHGGGGNARQMERHSRFNAIAEGEGFLVCYPQGYEKNWNDGRGAEQLPAQRENVDDIKFLRAIVDAIGREHKLERSRIFSTGVSNGAFMSHRLAAEASDLICGIAPVVGGLPEPIADSFNPQYPVSLLVIQGDSDPLVPFAGGEVNPNRPRPRGKFIAKNDTIAKYVAANGITGSPTTLDIADKDPNDGTTTTATIYPDGTDGAKVQLYVVRGGGHAWPGTRSYASLERIVGKTSKDFDASQVIWEFFKSCPPRKVAGHNSR